MISLYAVYTIARSSHPSQTFCSSDGVIGVNYLYLQQQWHCINAVVEADRIRYFDTSAYAQIVDPKDRRIPRPSKLAGFDAADIAPVFIESDHWL